MTEEPELPELTEEQLLPALYALEHWLRGHRHDYAGMDRTPGFIAIGFTRDVRSLVSQARALVPYPARIRGFAAEFTPIELEFCDLRLFRDDEALLERGIVINKSYFDVPQNRLVVEAEGDVEANQRALETEYGRCIKVEPSEGPFLLL